MFSNMVIQFILMRIMWKKEKVYLFCYLLMRYGKKIGAVRHTSMMGRSMQSTVLGLSLGES
ncbi:MAG: hypothetical protein CUR33_19090 [Pseudomonas sp.]|nr:MAG: hypothetical protein CUR33_19090 [Pseudomonas sp.] [Pseudomonas sp. FEMGT703P]